MKSSPHTEKLDLLTATFALCLLDKSLTSQALEKLTIDARHAAERKVAVLKPSRTRSIDFDVLGHVIYRWKRSSKYLDEYGAPLSIKARGSAPSVEALFREIDRADYFELGLKHLRQLGHA